MQCTSEYPSNIKSGGIELVRILKKKFKVYTGLSDHSGKISPSIMALSLGAKVIEVHFKINESKKNLDKDASLNFNELEFLCKCRDEIYVMHKNKTNKNVLSKDQIRNKKIFTKSIALKKNMEKNDTIKRNDITFKKPGYGIKYNDLKKVIGKKLKKNTYSNRLLKWSDLN